MRDFAVGARAWRWKRDASFEELANPHALRFALKDPRWSGDLDEWARRIGGSAVLRRCIVDWYGLGETKLEALSRGGRYDPDSQNTARRLLWIFGLEDPASTNIEIVQKALARAWDDFWRYANTFSAYEDAVATAKGDADDVEAAKEALIDAVSRLASKKRAFGADLAAEFVGGIEVTPAENERLDTPNPDLLRRYLEQELSKTIAWARKFSVRNDAGTKRRKNWLMMRPDRYLYLRLAEVFSYLLGVAAPLDDNGERRPASFANRPSSAPDQEFLRFSEVLLAAARWPVTLRASDKKDLFRDINERIPDARQNMRGLAGLSRNLTTYMQDNPQGELPDETRSKSEPVSKSAAAAESTSPVVLGHPPRVVFGDLASELELLQVDLDHASNVFVEHEGDDELAEFYSEDS